MDRRVNNYSEDFWLDDAAYMKWKRFMSHDWANPSRYLAYHLIADFVCGWADKVSVAEIGFGDGYDFRWFFQPFHDMGKIKYIGYEIMLPFVENAMAEYDKHGHLFRQGGFMGLEPMNYDLIFTRHTLEHIHPMLWRRCLVKMLRAAKECCVITWYLPPRDKRIDNWIGNGWRNTYRYRDVQVIIEKMGFSLELWQLDSGDHVYRADRE